MLPYCPSKGQETNPPWWGNTFIWSYYKAIQFVKMNTMSFRFVSALLLHVAAPMQKPVIFMTIAGPHRKSGGAAISAWKLVFCTLDCIIFWYRAVRHIQPCKTDCSVKIQENLTAFFVEICILEICKAAPWSSKDILFKIWIIRQALWCCLWGGSTSAWAQKRL